MNVGVLTGTTFVAKGLKYIPQSVSLLKYLSSPVMMGPTPKPILNTHQLVLRRLSKPVILSPARKSGEWANGYKNRRNFRHISGRI
jgi:hypothetical protein